MPRVRFPHTSTTWTYDAVRVTGDINIADDITLTIASSAMQAGSFLKIFAGSIVLAI